MKYVELKKHIKTEELYCCYNIFGDDSFLTDKCIEFFFEFVAKDELSKTILSAENFDVKNVLSILNTSSFFGGQKVVLLKDVEDGKEKQLADVILSNQNNFESGNILLVLSKNPLFDEKKLQNLNKNSKFLCLVDCNRLDEAMIFQWLNMTLLQKNGRMEEDAKRLLVDYTNGYLSRISLELDKLLSYKQGEAITVQDVEKLVTKSLEYSIYELTENLGSGNKQKSLEILDEMMADRKVSLSVFSLVQNHFRRMFYSAITPKTNVQIGELLGVKEFAVKKAKQQSQNFSKVALKNIVELCADLDTKIKTSQISYNNAVYYLIYTILDFKK